MLGGVFEQEGAGEKNKGRGGCFFFWGGEGHLIGLGRTYVGACCTRGARPRRSIYNSISTTWPKHSLAGGRAGGRVRCV